MQFGFTPKEIGEFDEQIVEEIHAAENAGFDSLWVTEHHVEGDRFSPAPLSRLAAFARETSSMDLVTSVVLLPLHHPLEIAERAAIVDQLSNGRLTLGVSYGYVPEEYDGFGVDMDERTGRLVEGVQVLDGMLSSDEPFSFSGKFWSFDDWEQAPPTVQEPRPSIWIGGYGDLTLKRSIALADGWMPGVSPDFETLGDRMAVLQDYADDLGIDIANHPRPLRRDVVVAETSEKAQELGETYLHPHYYEAYGSEEWSHRFISPEIAADFDELAKDRFLIGTPEEIVEQIETLQSYYDVDHLCCRFNYPDMPTEQVLDQIELFSDEIIPELE